MGGRIDKARRRRFDAPASLHLGRMRILVLSLVLAFCAVALRLVYIQIDQDVRFSDEELTHIGRAEIAQARGDITDRNGRLLATDRKSPSLCANPSRIADPSTLALQLSAHLAMDEGEVLAQLAKTGAAGERKRFAWIKRFLSPEEAAWAKEYLASGNVPGLQLVEENVRFYPEQTLGAHVLGFVNREGVGSEGVELAYDKYLRSESGWRVSRVDPMRRVLGSLTLEYEPPKGGDRLELTLDSAIQFSLESELDKALVKAEAPRGMGIVMDPNTGAILALACRPAYDPNTYTDFDSALYKNRAVVDVFEPGSSFKIVTASAALETGIITKDTMIDCENGSFNPYGHTIRDFHRLGVVPFTHCFAESSNIAMIKVAAKLEPERMETWIKRFGFGQKACPDFRAESAGIFHSRDKWSRLSMGSLPMGQEIAVTMPQLARAFAIIANGGYPVEPYVVERAIARDGTVTYEHGVKRGERIFSAETARTMRELCHLVVSEGTGSYASIPEYRVGGKTGTAQMADPVTGGYMDGKFTAVFAGFAPVADPKLVVVIVIEEPGIKLHYGGYCCGPVFREVVREALIKMDCPKDPMEGQAAAMQLAENDPDSVVTAGAIQAKNDEPIRLDGLELIPLEGDEVSVEPGLPDLTGMTKRQARVRLAALRVPWDVEGAGWVVTQDPPPGTPLSKVIACRLVFSDEAAQIPEKSTKPETIYVQ